MESLLSQVQNEIQNTQVNNAQLDTVKSESEDHFSDSELQGRAFRDESLSYSIYNKSMNFINNDEYNLDENFDDTQKDEMFKKKQGLIHEDFKDYIYDTARNSEHMSILLNEFERETKLENELEDLGIKGIAMRMFGSLSDAPLLLATAVTAEVTVPTLMVGASTTFFKRALMGAGTSLVFDAILDNIGEKDVKPLDYAIGAVTGCGINGVMRADPFLRDTSKRAIQRTLKTKKLNKNLLKASTDEEKEMITKKHIKDLNLNSEEKITINQSLANMEEQVQHGIMDNDLFNRFRTDTAYLTQTSESDTLSMIGKHMYIDGTLQQNQVNRMSGLEMGGILEEQLSSSSILNFQPMVNSFAKDAYGQGSVRARFGQANDVVSVIAGNVQMNRMLYNTSDDNAILLAKTQFNENGLSSELSEQYAKDLVDTLKKDALDSHRILKTNGKKGFEDDMIKTNDRYMPIQYDKNMKQNLENKGIKYKHFRSFIEDSLVSRMKQDNPKIDMNHLETKQLLDLLTDAMSSGIWHNKDGFNGNTDSFDDYLKRLLNADPERYKALGDILLSPKKIKQKDGSVFVQTKSPLDYSYRKTVKTEDGKEVEFGFDDLVNKNYFGIKTVYSRKMGGNLSLERTSLKNINTKNRVELDVLNKDIKALREALRQDAYMDSNENVANTMATFGDKYKDVEKDLDTLVRDIDDTYKEVYKQAIVKTKSELKKETPKEEFNKLVLENYEAMKKEINFDRINTLKDKVQRIEVEDVHTLDTRDGRDFIRTKIETELKEKGVSQSKVNSEMTRFNEMVNELQGNPTATDPFGTATQMQRIMKNMNIARLLGQVGFTMSAELASSMFHSGFKNFIEHSSFGKLIGQMRTGKMTDNLTQEIQTYMDLGTQLTKAIGSNRYDHDYNMAGIHSSQSTQNMLDKIEGISEKFSEATLVVGGVKPLSAWMEDVISKQTINNITMMLGKKAKLSKRDILDLNEYGIDMGMVKRIQGQFELFGETQKATFGSKSKVSKLNFDNWKDEEAQLLLINATRRITNTIIQKSNMGDKIGIVSGGKLFRNGLFGKFALELKDYMLTAYVKQLGRSVSRADIYTAGLLMSQAGALYMSTSIQNVINYAGNEDKLEESMEIENLTRNVFNKLPLSSIIPTIADTGLNAFTGETIFQQSRYSSPVQNFTMSLPSADLATKTFKALSIPFRSTFGEDGFTKNDYNTLLGLSPLGNTYGIRSINESIKSELEGK